MSWLPKWKNPTQTATYFAWKDMRRRCQKQSDPQWKDYGERGITVCERWRNDYDAFVEDMGERPDGMSLDRKDNSGDYTPENCRWATRTEQNRNARSNRYLEFQGRRMLLTDWAGELGIAVPTLHERLTKDYTPDMIFHKGPLTCRRLPMQFDL